MIKHIEQCSKCKVYVDGEPQRELSRKLLRSGASAGINKLLGWAIVSPIVGSIVPIVGTFFGFIITFFILLKIRSYSNTISNEIDKSMFEHTTYRFICPTCGNTWTKVLKTALSDIPDVILKEEKERKEILNGLQKSQNKFSPASKIKPHRMNIYLGPKCNFEKRAFFLNSKNSSHILSQYYPHSFPLDANRKLKIQSHTETLSNILN